MPKEFPAQEPPEKLEDLSASIQAKSEAFIQEAESFLLNPLTKYTIWKLTKAVQSRAKDGEHWLKYVSHSNDSVKAMDLDAVESWVRVRSYLMNDDLHDLGIENPKFRLADPVKMRELHQETTTMQTALQHRIDVLQLIRAIVAFPQTSLENLEKLKEEEELGHLVLESDETRWFQDLIEHRRGMTTTAQVKLLENIEKALSSLRLRQKDVAKAASEKFMSVDRFNELLEDYELAYDQLQRIRNQIQERLDALRQ